MEAEEPHVENENEQDSENGIDDNEINSATEQDTREEHINSNEHRNMIQYSCLRLNKTMYVLYFIIYVYDISF